MEAAATSEALPAGSCVRSAETPSLDGAISAAADVATREAAAVAAVLKEAAVAAAAGTCGLKKSSLLRTPLLCALLSTSALTPALASRARHSPTTASACATLT